ncbi:type II toxin-antitoxin system VapC family toxin [Anabaena lutea FACHB-196]|uniref:Type II toxin-antitoxin system VapC family toxin n=2 Tax=Anabaena TaxID=1163 RepID=A0ABR8FML0_9NOST|nr:type II toxin-antitoxin system VapC family toxin [Anabaena lutea FACHB-196]
MPVFNLAIALFLPYLTKSRCSLSELSRIGLHQLAVSAITQAELYYGAINNVELKKIKKHLGLLHIFSVDVMVSTQFIELMEIYSLSHKLSIPDALIASTALVHNIDLYTLNFKDFRFIEGLNLHEPPIN